MKITPFKIAAGGMLAALTVVMALIPFVGLIPVPTAGQALTTLHIPTVIAGITLGPLVGTLVGLIFGLFTWQRFGLPLIVALPARLLIGPAAYYAYRSARGGKLGLVFAAVAGTLTNTVGVLAMAVVVGLFPGPLATQVKTALTIAAIHSPIEIVLAATFVTLVLVPLKKATGLPADGAEGRQARATEAAEV